MQHACITDLILNCLIAYMHECHIHFCNYIKSLTFVGTNNTWPKIDIIVFSHSVKVNGTSTQEPQNHKVPLWA